LFKGDGFRLLTLRNGKRVSQMKLKEVGIGRGGLRNLYLRSEGVDAYLRHKDIKGGKNLASVADFLFRK